MKKEELYNIVLKAINGIDPKKSTRVCSNCLSWKIQEALKETDINYDYYNGSDCSNVLFYLEDLGFIKILSGVYDRLEGVRCTRQKYTIIKKIFKVIKYENSKTL